MSEPHAAAYRELRSGFRELIEAPTRARSSAQFRATPEWRAHDLLSHLVGVATDVVKGRLEGLASKPGPRRRSTLAAPRRSADLVAEWDECGPQFEVMMATAPTSSSGRRSSTRQRTNTICVTRSASPGARDSDAVGSGWHWIVDARTRGGSPASPSSSSPASRLRASATSSPASRRPIRALPRGLGSAHGRGDRGLRLGLRSRSVASPRGRLSSRSRRVDRRIALARVLWQPLHHRDKLVPPDSASAAEVNEASSSSRAPRPARACPRQ